VSPFPQRPFLAGQKGSASPAGGQRFVIAPPYLPGRAKPVPVSAVEDLPSIDEFLDRTPPIEKFAPSHVGEERATEWAWGGESVAPKMPAEAPAPDWQSFDWGSAANLGSSPPDAAAEAWASTDWSEPRGGKATRQSAAEALARALDQIAERIRAGELRVPGPETVQDDAAVTATLAALLGIRR
jgi:hypothetical protein